MVIIIYNLVFGILRWVINSYFVNYFIWILIRMFFLGRWKLVDIRVLRNVELVVDLK